MRGLLIKDYKLLTGQKRFVAIVLIAGILLFFVDEGNNYIFSVGYITFIFGFLTNATISYDEMDNGLAFLMTLPDGRSAYAKEKYVFALINMLGAWVIAVLLEILIQRQWWGRDNAGEILLSAVSVLALAALFLAVILPVSIIFGTEKGRIVIIVMGAILFLLGYFGSMAAETFQVSLDAVINAIYAQSEAALVLELLFVCIISLAISYVISSKQMRRKQF